MFEGKYPSNNLSQSQVSKILNPPKDLELFLVLLYLVLPLPQVNSLILSSYLDIQHKNIWYKNIPPPPDDILISRVYCILNGTRVSHLPSERSFKSVLGYSSMPQTALCPRPFLNSVTLLS